MKIRELFLFCFYDVDKENMFTINLEDGREAPYKASNFKRPNEHAKQISCTVNRPISLTKR